MLFHITATHTSANCPAYHRERMPEVIAAIENFENRAKELNVKVHALLSGASEHVTFLVLEADSSAAMAQLTTSLSFEQDFTVTPVVPEQELTAMAKAMMAQR
jgi:hypothetical protein